MSWRNLLLLTAGVLLVVMVVYLALALVTGLRHFAMVNQ